MNRDERYERYGEYGMNEIALPTYMFVAYQPFGRL